jgi:hypothetical protein
MFREQFVDTEWVTMDEWGVDSTFFDTEEEAALAVPSPVNWKDTSLNRNYDFFGFIANGLRRAYDNSLELRGIPKHTCPEVKAHHESWGIDAHSESHMSLVDLKKHLFKFAVLNNTEEDERIASGLKEMYDKFPQTKCPEHFRVIFWFDN